MESNSARSWTLPSREKLLNLLTRDYTETPLVGDSCTAHRLIPFAERSIDCPLCAHQFRRVALHALDANRWLNDWRDDAINVMKENA